MMFRHCCLTHLIFEAREVTMDTKHHDAGLLPPSILLPTPKLRRNDTLLFTASISAIKLKLNTSR
jgi:hypothetical protein